MSYEKLDYVIAVAQEQNLTKAAERLYISQPALTAALNKLEAELGVKLFDRKRPPVKLTAAGGFYIQEMSRIRHLKMNMESILHQIARPQLRLSIGRGRGYYWLPILLPAFARLHPDICITASNAPFNSLSDALLSRDTDIGIGTYHLAAPGIEEQDVVTEKLVYVIPRSLDIIDEKRYTGHSLWNPLVVEPSLLNGQPFVCPEASSTYFHYIETEMSHYNYRYGEQMIYDTPQAALHLACSGMGCTFASQNMCEWEQVESRYPVFFCTLSPTPPSQTIRISYPVNTPHDTLFQDMIRIIREELIPKLYPAGAAHL